MFKKSSLFILFLGFLVGATIVSWQNPHRLHPLYPMVVAPQFHKLVFENDKVRVLDVQVKPGEFEPFHKHRQGVLVILEGGKARFKEPDGTTKEVSFSANPDPKKGEPPQAFWEDPVTHSVENIGSTAIRLIRIELK
jgi:hypothetical protein